MKNSFLALLFSLSLVVTHSLQAESIKLPHLESFENQIKKSAVISFKTEPGHHFNQASPLSCGQDMKIFKLEAQKISCRYDKEGTYRPFLAVCDDGKKFCKIFRPEISVGHFKSKGQAKIFKANQKQKLHHGFKLGSPEVAIENNLKSKKPLPLLLDFFALWCPPCNDLDELIFNTTLFKNETALLEKIKINVDEEESWNLKEKFNVLYYPTLIYLNPQGEMIGRFSGTQSPEILVNWLKKMKSLEAMPLSWAEKQADAESVKRVSEEAYETENYDKVLSLTSSRSEAWAKRYALRAEYMKASANKDTKTQIKKLEALLKEFPQDILFSNWLMLMANIDKSKGKKHLDKAIQNIEDWKKKPQELLNENYSLQDLYILKTDLLETYEKKDQMVEARNEAIQLIEKNLDGGKIISRGRSPVLAYYYRESGRAEEAKKIYEALVRDNPNEFTFYIRYANALKDLKETLSALEWLEKGAVYLTDGNSKIQYATLKGKLLSTLGRTEEALQIVEGTLAISKSPKWKNDRATHLLKDLQELKVDLDLKNSADKTNKTP